MAKNKSSQPHKIQLKQHRSPCPIACTLDLIGDKWTLLVIRDLLLGCQLYKEFMAQPEGIATNILATRLDKLVIHGLVEKRPSKTASGRAAYFLTDQGKGLATIIKDLHDWGLQHIENTESRLTLNQS